MKLNLSVRSLLLLAAVAVLPVSESRAQTMAAGDKLVEKHLVQIEGGRRLNMNCLGRGSPTVIFEQGLGAHILSWEKVAPAIASVTKTCVYDRAGEGFSDPSERPATAENVDLDLRALVRAAGIDGPVVLVGHSIGGLYATLFADEYPDDVAGLVLVDPSFAGQDLGITSPKQKQDYAEDYRQEVADLTRCITLARAAPIGENNPACPWSFSPQRTDFQKLYLGYAFGHSYKWAEELSELQAFQSDGSGASEDEIQEERARRSFGPMPVIVLTAGQPPALQEGQTPEDQAREREVWRKGHDALAARSRQGKSVVVPGASHFIQIDRPDAVISAVQEVISKVRAKPSK
jgi:pimeloyl-ACP methyl ester carboxylesterase